MQYLKIHDWDEWQSYRKDRGQPPWIKIHRCLMRNMKWVSMSDSERGQLVAIWLLAADHNGQIPSSPDVLQKLCFMEKKPNINKFIELGFIDGDGCHGDAKMAPDGCHGDAPDKSRDRVETETEKNRNAPPDGVSVQVWEDFKTLRKAKRMPITQTAINGILKESFKAGISLNNAFSICCERGWGSFKSEWLNNGVSHEINKSDSRSRAKKFSDKLDEIAIRAVETHGFTDRVD